MKTRTKVLIGVGVYLADRDPAAADLRQRRQGSKTSSPRTSSSSNRGSRSTSAASTSASTRRFFYLLLASSLTILTMVWIARRMHQKPNRVQTAVEVAYDLTKNNITGGNLDGAMAARWFPFLAALFFWIWFSNMIGFLPAADQHRARDHRLRPADPGLRDLRGDGEPLDPAGADPGRLALLPLRRDPRQGLDPLPEELAAAGPGGDEPDRQGLHLRDRGDLSLRPPDLALRATLRQHPRRPPAAALHGRRAGGTARHRRPRAR